MEEQCDQKNFKIDFSHQRHFNPSSQFKKKITPSINNASTSEQVQHHDRDVHQHQEPDQQATSGHKRTTTNSQLSSPMQSTLLQPSLDSSKKD